jgi:hypothetical protein
MKLAGVSTELAYSLGKQILSQMFLADLNALFTSMKLYTRQQHHHQVSRVERRLCSRSSRLFESDHLRALVRKCVSQANICARHDYIIFPQRLPSKKEGLIFTTWMNARISPLTVEQEQHNEMKAIKKASRKEQTLNPRPRERLIIRPWRVSVVARKERKGRVT